MDSEKIWKKSDWTDQARQIIEGINLFPDDSKIILVLRHSHRNEIEGLEGAQKLRLTPQGHAIAKIFGENLPNNRPIKLFHSIIWRCEHWFYAKFSIYSNKAQLLKILVASEKLCPECPAIILINNVWNPSDI